MTADKEVQAMAKLREGFALQQQGRLADAKATYRDVLKLQPRQFDALHLSGVIAAQLGDYDEAVRLIGRALDVDPNNVGAHYNLGHVQEDMKRYGAAVKSYDRAIALKPDHAVAYNNRGTALKALGQFDAAVASFDKALALAPDYVEALYNKGVALEAAGRKREAAESFQKAAILKPDHAEALLAAAILLRDLKEPAAALVLCDKAIALKPAAFNSTMAEAHNARGTALADLHQLEAALASFERALALKADYPEAYNNRGTIFSRLKRYPAAIESFNRVLDLKPDHADALHNRGWAFNALAQYPAAIEDFDRALQLKPDYAFLRGARLNAQLIICERDGLAARIADINDRTARGESVSSPLSILATSDSPALHRQVAEVWMRKECPPNSELGPIAPRPAGKKIRLGYFSMDFRLHAVSILAAGLFEAHDRTAFEVYAFSYGPDTGDVLRQRLQRGFDHFLDVREKSDADIAATARDLQIDIAIDLGGYTADCRTGIFARRAAPVQVNYLGYPGTMGAPYMDYIIGDGVVIPPEARVHYAEKVVTLPGSYQCNDQARPRPAGVADRTQYGLPPRGFVFCCFNLPSKILPETFAAWMRILRRVPDSVLWLYSNNEIATVNLRRHAEEAGIDAGRLIFAGQVALDTHLARYHAVDLLLDTWPYNAHTTASDALWMGAPVVTRLGASFPARVAASLLTTLGLPELITTTAEEYESLAVALAEDPQRLVALKQKIALHRETSLLFDTAAFAGHLEQGYRRMMQRHNDGLSPDHIDVLK